MATQPTSIAQRSRQKLYFDHQDMDYYFSWITGREVYEGSEAGECFEVAARIADGDAANWQREWRGLAEHVEAQARATHEYGDADAARRAYLRACICHRAPPFMTKPQDPAFRGANSDWSREPAGPRRAARIDHLSRTAVRRASGCGSSRLRGGSRSVVHSGRLARFSPEVW